MDSRLKTAGITAIKTMDIRKNIALSIFVHALIIAPVFIITATGGDKYRQLPADYILVSLMEKLDSVSARIQISQEPKNIPEIKLQAELKPDGSFRDNPFHTVNETEQKQTEIRREITSAGQSIADNTNDKRNTTNQLQAQTSGAVSTTNTPSQKAFEGVYLNNSEPAANSGEPFRDRVSVSEPKSVLTLIRAAIERAKAYPYLARKRKTEGTTVVIFSVDLKGLPQNIKLAKSSGSEILDSAAVATITKAAPYPIIKTPIEIPITFKLTDKQ